MDDDVKTNVVRHLLTMTDQSVIFSQRQVREPHQGRDISDASQAPARREGRASQAVNAGLAGGHLSKTRI
jgi:hypothetical protein